jgi:hypothetical protein
MAMKKFRRIEVGAVSTNGAMMVIKRVKQLPPQSNQTVLNSQLKK